MRSSMLEVVRQDYMRTARAKGQGAKITVLKHGFRNALIPLLSRLSGSSSAGSSAARC